MSPETPNTPDPVELENHQSILLALNADFVRGVHAAVRRLNAAVAGDVPFADEFQLRAATALVRYAPQLLVGLPKQVPIPLTCAQRRERDIGKLSMWTIRTRHPERWEPGWRHKPENRALAEEQDEAWREEQRVIWNREHAAEIDEEDARAHLTPPKPAPGESTAPCAGFPSLLDEATLLETPNVPQCPKSSPSDESTEVSNVTSESEISNVKSEISDLTQTPKSPATDYGPRTTDSASTTDSLSPKQIKALTLMLAGRPDTHIARAVDVDRRTLYRWRNEDPAFASALESRRQELFDQTGRHLAALLQPSMQTLERQAAHPNHRISHRAIATLLRTATTAKLLKPPEKQAA